jgi:hypothetical protein
MSKLYTASRILSVIIPLVAGFLLASIGGVLVAIPFAVISYAMNERGIAQYQKYDNLAWYENLSEDDKDSLDWYLEDKPDVR